MSLQNEFSGRSRIIFKQNCVAYIYYNKLKTEDLLMFKK